MARLRQIARRICFRCPREPRVRSLLHNRLPAPSAVCRSRSPRSREHKCRRPLRPRPLGRRDDACGNRRGDRGHRGCDVGRSRDRRQIELYRPRAPRRDDALEAEPHRCRVTVEGEFHDLPGQRLGFGVEQCLGGARRAVPAPSGLPAGLPDWPFAKWPSGVRST